MSLLRLFSDKARYVEAYNAENPTRWIEAEDVEIRIRIGRLLLSIPDEQAIRAQSQARIAEAKAAVQLAHQKANPQWDYPVDFWDEPEF